MTTQAEMTTNETQKPTDGVTCAAEDCQCSCVDMFSPDVDVIEAQDETLLVMDVPGATSDGIDIKFEQGELTVCARVNHRQTPNTRYLLSEYQVGDYFRTFSVGDDIDPEGIRAEVNSGVLTIHLPKSETAKPRKIAVQSAT